VPLNTSQFNQFYLSINSLVYFSTQHSYFFSSDFSHHLCLFLSCRSHLSMFLYALMPLRNCSLLHSCFFLCFSLSPLLDNVRVMVIVWRLRGNIIRTALCWVLSHNVYSLQYTHVSSSCRSSRLDLSHWDPYAVRRGGCLELYYCNMVEWCLWDSSLI